MLFFLYVIAAASGSLAIVFVFDITPLWLFLLPAGIFYSFSALHIGVFFVISELTKRTPETISPDSRVYRFLLYETIFLLLRLMRVRIHVRGKELIPKDTAFLLVSNHLSHFDPMVSGIYLRNSKMVFISKPENFKVPLVGPYITRLGFIPIDRTDTRSAMHAVNTAAERIKENRCCVGVYPEGTISRSLALMGFHDGVFLAAKKADVPVLVSTLRGTPYIKKRWWHIGTDVYLTFEGVISQQEVETLRTCDVGAKAREMMRLSLLAHGMIAVPNEEATVPDLSKLKKPEPPVSKS